MVNIQTLTIEFMEEFYSHVREKTPSFMTRPAEEVQLATNLEALLIQANAALYAAEGPDDIMAGMTPLVANMTLLIEAYTQEGEERNSWIGQMDEFRAYVIGELTGGS